MAKINFLNKKKEVWKEPVSLDEAEAMSKELDAKMNSLLKLPNDEFLSEEVTKELTVLHEQIFNLTHWLISHM